MTTYIVADKRMNRANAPVEWVEQANETDGVNIESVSSSKRALIQITSEDPCSQREVQIFFSSRREN